MPKFSLKENIKYWLSDDSQKLNMLVDKGLYQRISRWEDIVLDMINKAGIGGSNIASPVDAVAKQAYAAAGLKIARNTINSLPLILKRKGSDKPVTSGKVYDWIQLPSGVNTMPLITLTDFLDKSVINYYLGKIIWWLDPLEKYIYVLPSKEVSVNMRQKGKRTDMLARPIKGLKWQDDIIPVEECVYIPHRTADKEDEGSSPLNSSMDDIKADVAAADFMKKLLLKGARPNLYFKTDQQLTTEKLKEYKRIVENEYTGVERAGKPPVLDRNWEIKTLQLTNQDMQLAESRGIHNDAILVSLGIAKIMVKAGEATYENLREAEGIYWRYQGEPLANKIKQAFNRAVLPKVFPGQNFEVEFDYSSVPAVRYLQRKAAEGAKDAVYATVNEVRRDFYGLPPLQGEEGEMMYVPSMSIGIPVKIEGKRKADVHPLFEKWAKANKGVIKKTKEPQKSQDKIGGYTQEQRHVWSARVDATLQGFERSFIDKEFKALRRQENLIKDVINAMGDNDDIGQLPEIPTIIDWLDEEARFKKFSTPIIRAAIEHGGNTWLNNHNGTFEYTEEHELKAGKQGDKFARYVNKTNVDKLEKAVLAIRNKEIKTSDWYRGSKSKVINLPVAKRQDKEEEKTDKELMLLALAAIYAVAKDSRTKTAAATEMHDALNYGVQEGMIQGGVEVKQWVTMMDGHERDWHAALDGETVGIREVFSNGLSYPGDPIGSAEEVANCRCTMLDVRGE